MLKTTITLLLSAITVVCSAQTDNKQTMPRSTWQQYFDQLNDIDDMESSNLEELYDQMCELEDSPVNLNSATADDIKRLMFLNAAQTEELTEYIDRHRPLRSIGELAMIKSIDPIRLQLLMCFTYIGEETDKKGYPKLGDILKYGKHDVWLPQRFLSIPARATATAILVANTSTGQDILSATDSICK